MSLTSVTALVPPLVWGGGGGAIYGPTSWQQARPACCKLVWRDPYDMRPPRQAANHTDEMRWSKKHNRKCLIFNFYFSDDALRRKNVAVNILFYFLGRARINRTAARTQLWEGIETCRLWKKTQNQYEQIMWPPSISLCPLVRLTFGIVLWRRQVTFLLGILSHFFGLVR